MIRFLGSALYRSERCDPSLQVGAVMLLAQLSPKTTGWNHDTRTLQAHRDAWISTAGETLAAVHLGGRAGGE